VPGELAEELMNEGYSAIKLWTLDRVAHKTKGLYIHPEGLERAIAPFFAIRERVGMRVELVLDGHGFFLFPAAVRIAEALREAKLMWLEDLLRVDCVDSLVDFRRIVSTPIAASEMFNSVEDFRSLLEKRGADYVLIDPTWVGGISQTMRIARMAEAYNIPVLIHDCTGPLTLLAGLQVATAVPNVVFQETVRAHIRTFYKDLIDDPIVVQSGSIAPPVRPGIGVRLNPDLFDSHNPGYRLSGKLN